VKSLTTSAGLAKLNGREGVRRWTASHFERRVGKYLLLARVDPTFGGWGWHALDGRGDIVAIGKEPTEKKAKLQARRWAERTLRGVR
jgi:hypothetical protein